MWNIKNIFCIKQNFYILFNSSIQNTVSVVQVCYSSNKSYQFYWSITLLLSNSFFSRVEVILLDSKSYLKLDTNHTKFLKLSNSSENLNFVISLHATDIRNVKLLSE